MALWWSAVFGFVAARSSSLRKALRSRAGIVAIAAIYGPLVWMTMSLLVIPAFIHRQPTINARWWVQLAGHFPFVGLPIVASISGGKRSAAPRHFRPSGKRRSRAPS